MSTIRAAVALICLPITGEAQMPSADLVTEVRSVPEIQSHADWRSVCTDVGCTAEPATQVTPLSIVVTRNGDGEVLVLRAPLGLLLAEGVAVVIDGRTVGRLAFLTCEVEGCVAPVRLNGSLRDALRSGRALELTLVRRDGSELSAEYSLMGFISATSNLAATLDSDEVAP